MTFKTGSAKSLVLLALVLILLYFGFQKCMGPSGPQVAADGQTARLIYQLKGKTVYFGLMVTNSSGRNKSYVALKSNRPASPPTIKIYDAGDTLLGSVKMRAG